jgi:cytochrome b561
MTARRLPSRYHPALVALHWLLAVLLLFMLGMGTFSLANMPNTAPEKLFALRGHMVFGLAVLVLTLARLALRLRTPRPAPAGSGHPLLDRLARMAHPALYALVILMAASGIALAAMAGLPGIVFGGAGSLPESFSAFLPRTAHGVIAKLLLVLIGLHVAAALYHQLGRRDGLMSRMGFGRKA